MRGTYLIPSSFLTDLTLDSSSATSLLKPRFLAIFMPHARSELQLLLLMSNTVQDRVLTDGTERAIQEAATSDGMVGMFRDGVDKVLAGETTLDEVLRVTRVSA